MLKHLPAGAGRSFVLMGSTLTFKDEPDDNGDALLASEHECPPGLGVPPHRERNHEAFYVLDGTLEVEADGERYRLEAGAFLAMPAGVVHSLHNPGPDTMRVLTIVSPGAGHARFFAAASEQSDPERVQQIAHQCGIDFVSPKEGDDGR
jgi:quercetin dioxygenase-like cupin family protein